MILRYNALSGAISISLLLRLPTIVLGDDTTSVPSQVTPTTMATTRPPSQTTQNNQPFPLLSSSPLPSSSDAAPNGHKSNVDSTGLVNYYFVFLALIIAVVAAVVYLFFRKRHKAAVRNRYSQQEALTRDLGGARPGGGWSNWHPERTTRGRYWQGRWRTEEESREEGLNEQGEAPPPYVPKRRSQEAQREVAEPDVPLQTLSRDGAGLKPPDYSEYHSHELDQQARSSAVSGSSSRDVERRTSP